MVRTYLLNVNQRAIIEEYLRDLPSSAPLLLRRIRWSLNKKDEDGRPLIDLDQIQYDLDLLRALKDFEIPIGRGKKEGWADQRSVFIVRQSSFKELKAKTVFKKQGRSD